MSKPNKEGSRPQNPVTPDAASRIQSHADKTGTNQGFKSRAQAAAARNTQAGSFEDGKK